MKIQQIKFSGLALATAVAMGTMINSAPGQAAETEKSEAPTVLFVQNAEGITYDKASGVMTLKDSGSLVTWFSDRPVRAAGHIVTSSFVKIWDEGKDSFKKNPPNANLSIIGGGKITNVVVELSNPTLKGKEMSYNVKVLEGELPATGGTCSLFIDGLFSPAATPGGGAVKGGVTGALIGAISGNVGRGAAIGAGVGLLRSVVHEGNN